MNDRQKEILKEIVENHIDAAEPIGSKMLADNFKLSSATIRNEMAELEKMGLIMQPHTSAGRIPTEQGYRFYINHYLDREQPLDTKLVEVLQEVADFALKQKEDLVKHLARALAELSRAATFAGFGKFEMYYTGLSNLFIQPEFREIEIIRDLSAVIDHLDEVTAELFDRQMDDCQVLIGSDNPFGEDCSSLMIKVQYQERPLLFGILGPLRMDYQNNYALLKYANKLIV